MFNKSPEAITEDGKVKSQLLERYTDHYHHDISCKKWRISLYLSLSFSQLFSDVAYKARDREDLIAGIDEFLDEVIVLPPGEWDPKIRIEPPKKVPSADKRLGFYYPPISH